jgi:hypothetical protein
MYKKSLTWPSNAPLEKITAVEQGQKILRRYITYVMKRLTRMYKKSVTWHLN